MRLATPDIHKILEAAGNRGSTGTDEGTAMLIAMRKDAEKRVAGVTKSKRRRYYGHAVELVAACAALDPTPAAATWVAGIRADYRRYPTLQRELDHHLGNA